MYCAKCGAQIVEGSSFCGKCGAPVTQPVTQPQPTASPAQPQSPAATRRTSGLAITSLVCGIVGLFLHFLSILAIIFGGVALAQIGKNPALKGRGMAVAGLVLGIITVIAWIAIIVWAESFWWWRYF
jgi:hypothetical protein